jgi:hypothetical protein
MAAFQADHVLRDRGFGDVQTKFHELAVNSRSSPKHAHRAHGANEIARMLRDVWSSWMIVTDLPGPIPAERLPMPTHDSFRFDDEQCGTPTGPDSRKANPEPTICWTQHEALRLLGSLQHDDLVTEREDLRFHRHRRLKGEKRTENHQYHGEHGARRLPTVTGNFNNSNDDEILGKPRETDFRFRNKSKFSFCEGHRLSSPGLLCFCLPNFALW